MAAAVYSALGVVLVVVGTGLAANVGRLAERVVGVLARDAADAPSRVQRWRGLGTMYIVAGALLLVVGLLSR